MAGLNRTQIAGFFWSGVCNTLVLGGIVWGLGVFPQARKLGSASEPLVVEMIPLNDAQSGSARREPLPVARPGGAVVAAAPIPSAVRAPSSQPLLDAAGFASSSAGSGEALSGKTDTSAADAQLLTEYQRILNELIARNTRYPMEARRLRLAGTTRLAFSLDRTGRVLSSWIAASSGAGSLDVAALEGLERSDPLPPIPAGLPERLNFVVEIDSSMTAM